MVLTVFSILLALFHFVGPMPTDLGIHQGQLSSCESPAHCARLEWERNDPIGSLKELAEVIKQTPRSEIIPKKARKKEMRDSKPILDRRSGRIQKI